MDLSAQVNNCCQCSGKELFQQGELSGRRVPVPCGDGGSTLPLLPGSQASLCVTISQTFMFFVWNAAHRASSSHKLHNVNLTYIRPQSCGVERMWDGRTVVLVK